MKSKTFALAGIFAALLVMAAATAPMANAQEKDDDDKKKCKGHKYGNICDKQKPELKVATPKPGTKFFLGDTLTVTGFASDKKTGIKLVKVSFDAPGVVVSTHDGPFSFSAPIVKTGHFVIAVKAQDKAGNWAIKLIPIQVVKK